MHRQQPQAPNSKCPSVVTICRSKPKVPRYLRCLPKYLVTAKSRAWKAWRVNRYSIVVLPTRLQVNICTDYRAPTSEALRHIFSQQRDLSRSESISKSAFHGRYGPGRCRKQVLIRTSPILHRASRGSPGRQRTRGACSDTQVQRPMLTQLFSLPNYWKRMGQKR